MGGTSYNNRGMRFAGGPRTFSKKLSHVERANQRRAARPGYPIETPFRTPQDVNDYLSGDRITCLRCGKSYKSLGMHLRVHGWTDEQYRAFYGLPWTRGLVCSSTREKMEANAAKKVAEGKAFGGPENYGKYVKEALSRPRRKYQPYRKLVAASNIAKAPTRNKSRVLNGEFKLWEDQDYWQIPDIMQSRDMTLKEVCALGDIPQTSAVFVFSRENPDFKNRLDKAWDSLSFAALKRAQRLGKRFKAEASRLRAEGFSGPQIADKLGVSVGTVEKHISGVPVPEKTHCAKGHQYPADQIGGVKHCQQCNTENARLRRGHMERSESAKTKISVDCMNCGKPVEVSRLRGKNRKARCRSCFLEYHRQYDIQKRGKNRR